jgi:hypothetical protein
LCSLYLIIIEIGRDSDDSIINSVVTKGWNEAGSSTLKTSLHVQQNAIDGGECWGGCDRDWRKGVNLWDMALWHAD